MRERETWVTPRAGMPVMLENTKRSSWLPALIPMIRESPVLSIHGVVADDVLDDAYRWLCERRKRYPDAAVIWTFRQRWPRERERIRQELIAGTYRFGLLSRVRRFSTESLDLWSAPDALVLKCLALTLASALPRSPRCFHLKAIGGDKKGAKAALRAVMDHLAPARFVLKTDVKSYYASIDHARLMNALADYVHDSRITSLVYQYPTRCAERGGLFFDHTQGIPLGCALSPLIGAFFLHRLDVAMERVGLFCVRFMDDVLVLAPTRHKLRQARARGEPDPDRAGS